MPQLGICCWPRAMEPSRSPSSAVVLCQAIARAGLVAGWKNHRDSHRATYAGRHRRFLAVDVATGQDHVVGVSPDRIYYGPAWMPDGSALITSAMKVDAGSMQRQIGYVNYPDGQYRALTADTNNYGNWGSPTTARPWWPSRANCVSRYPLRRRTIQTSCTRSLWRRNCHCGAGIGCRMAG